MKLYFLDLLSIGEVLRAIITVDLFQEKLKKNIFILRI
jgi:hypothetical protein